MSIEVQQADADALASWDQWLAQSEAGTFFHQIDVLDVLNKHAETTLHHLVGFKGNQPVGALPVFELSKGPFTFVLSPPPKLGVPALGPVLFDADQLKRHTLEKRNRRFIDGCVDWINSNISPNYTRIVSEPAYHDPRPFAWNGFDMTPYHTYHVDLTAGESVVMDRFKKSLRSDIRRSQDEDYTVRRGDKHDARWIINKVEERYEAQGEAFTITPSYIDDLLHAVGLDQLPVYVGELNGERISGILSPRFDSTMYYWQGGGRPDVSFPMNDLIHWQLIQDGIDEGYAVYDLVGANTRRLCEYKSKFGPSLRTYYELEAGSTATTLLTKLYKRLQ